MSTDQPELSDFAAVDAATAHEDALDGVGAAYAADETATASAPQQERENVCLNCGSDLEARTARVIGDNNGCVPACADEECRKDALGEIGLAHDSYRETARVAAAVRSSDRSVGDRDD